MGMEEKKHPGGRPSKYQEIHTCAAVEYMAAAGLTDKQMAAKLDMSEVSFNAWKQEHEEFLKSLKAGKDKADDRVEKSLYKNAVGYNYKAHKPMTVSDGNGDGSHIEIAEYTEHVPAQTIAQIFWLKNRRPEQWRDRQQVEHSGEINSTLSVKQKTERLSDLIKELSADDIPDNKSDNDA